MGDRAKDTPPESRSLRLKRSVAGALGLGAAGLLASAPAEAATELAQLADSDGRLGILLTLFVPVVGWVLFNIAGPAFSQLDVSRERGSCGHHWPIAGFLSASTHSPMLAASAQGQRCTLCAAAHVQTSAAQPHVPLVLCVTQIMGDRAKDTPPESRSLRVKRSVAGALGLGAAGLLASAPAEAATELAQLADSDGRLGILLTLFVPVVGWVLFNIAGPAFGQLGVSAHVQRAACQQERMRTQGRALTLHLAPSPSLALQVMGDKAKDTPPEKRSFRSKRSVAGALGLGAAGLLAASAPAEAATELAQLADSDGRLGILLTLFVPVVGWVLFNIAGPAFGQLDVSGGRLLWFGPCGSVLRCIWAQAGPTSSFPIAGATSTSTRHRMARMCVWSASSRTSASPPGCAHQTLVRRSWATGPRTRPPSRAACA